MDRRHVTLPALHALARQGGAGRDVPGAALERYAIDPDAPPPWEA